MLKSEQGKLKRLAELSKLINSKHSNRTSSITPPNQALLLVKLNIVDSRSSSRTLYNPNPQHNTHNHQTSNNMLVSHGRGGAGNIANSSKFDKLTTKDLQTPTLKSSVVTTGRGGTGNIFKEDNAAVQKAAAIENAIDDDDSSSHKRRRSSAELAAKGKAWLNSITGKKA
ncbi:hypothetical protein HYQ44_005776 [Verticillium longisporum]|nr:hypothetical protein HYQ44_005776 [Verticillium longisporum]